jgi:nickel transport protein
MKYNNTFISFLLLTAFMLPSLLYAHGVTSKIDTGGIVVSAMYDTGEAMDYARVTISAPGASLRFQSGRTDRNGRFCFFPDVSGDWKVVVDDEMGHRLEVNVFVDQAMSLQASRENEKAGPGYLTRWQKAIMGVSIIFGISSILFWWRGRKSKE